MNKGDYLSELHKYLADMPATERDSAMRFYMEYFDDAGAENEQTVMLQLGTPRQLADQLLAEMGAAKHPATETGAPRQKRRWRWWMWALAVMASPVLAGLAAGALGLLVGLLAAAFSLALAAMIVALVPVLVSAALAVSGVFVLGNGLIVLNQSYATSLWYAGVGMVAVSGGALLFQPALRVLQGGSRVGFKFSGWVMRKLRLLRPRGDGEGR